MITAVDANVLFDLFRTDSLHHSRARQWLNAARDGRIFATYFPELQGLNEP